MLGWALWRGLRLEWYFLSRRLMRGKRFEIVVYGGGFRVADRLEQKYVSETFKSHKKAKLLLRKCELGLRIVSQNRQIQLDKDEKKDPRT
jgi:hypothetical protein